MDPLIEEETLASFVVDLAPGAHAIAILDTLHVGAAVERCRRIARDTGERVVLAGGPASQLDWARATRSDLEALARDAREAGAPGALVLVDAKDSAHGASLEDHVGNEGALGRGPIDGLRILCVYDREVAAGLDADMLVRAAMAHSIALTPRAGRVA